MQSIYLVSTQDMSQLVTFIDKHLLKYTGYLAHDLYVFSSNTSSKEFVKPTSKEEQRIKCLIVAKEHYYEFTKIYPIGNRRELSKALKLENNHTPYDGKVFHAIERVDEQSHRVTFWSFNEESLSKYDLKPYFLLPESYLFTQGIGKEKFNSVISRSCGELFLIRSNKGTLSGIATNSIKDISTFAMATGNFSVTAEEVVRIPPSEFTEFIATSIKKISAVDLKSFWLAPQSKKAEAWPWQKALAPLALVGVSYVALTSAWIKLQQVTVEKELSDKQASIAQAFKLQKQHNDLQSYFDELNKPILEHSPFWESWRVIAEIIEMGATIRSVELKHGKVTIQGTANKGIKATSILETLMQNEMISSPGFSKPIRKSRGKEQFTIEFLFAENADNVSEKPLTTQVSKRNKNDKTS